MAVAATTTTDSTIRHIIATEIKATDGSTMANLTSTISVDDNGGADDGKITLNHSAYLAQFTDDATGAELDDMMDGVIAHFTAVKTKIAAIVSAA